MSVKSKFMQALVGMMFLASFAAFAENGGAESSVDLLVLKMADATTAEFELADEPVISFADGKLVVTSQSATTDYEQEAVTEFYFKKKDPVVDGINNSVGDFFSFTYKDNANVVIAGSKAKKASLYTIDGKSLQSQKVVNGTVTISLENYAPGIYVVNLEKEHTFKIIKK